MIALITQGFGATTLVTQGYGGVAVAPPPVPTPGGGGFPLGSSGFNPIGAVVFSDDYDVRGRTKPEPPKPRKRRQLTFEQCLVLSGFDFARAELEMQRCDG